ncbi:MAG: ABC transporter permease [Anaerolineaceae bacterium]|nr:ABC transporter permease [Anaerolineaceae bacterium]
MKLLQAIKEALQSLNANKTRAFLTILGIVIGVGSVIALLSVGQGAGDAITGQIESIGTNVVYIMRGNSAEDVKNPEPLTTRDAEALSNRNRAPSIANVSPIVQGNAELTFSGESKNSSVMGVTPAYAIVQNVTLSEGSFITKTHIDGRSAVVVIGPDFADQMFGKHTDVIGKSLRINGYPYRVVGVAEAKGGSQFNNPDLNVFVPITTAQMRIVRSNPQNRVQFILIQAKDSDSVNAAIEEANDILRDTHRISGRKPNDFTITNQQDFLSIAQSITGILTIFLGGIGAISLLVGGIGIMNIMLVSVTERTREIGLRKALGARRSDIMMQFLTESALLSLIGGIFGIVLGWSLALLVGFIAVRSGTLLNPTVGLDSILLATLFSAAVGIFFGWYPASRAARLQPVDALRYE